MSILASIERLRDFDAALLANTIGYIDPTPAHEIYMGGSIKLMTPNLGPLVGVAVTCKIDASSPNRPGDWAPFWDQMEEIQKIDLPVVWVVQAVGSRPDHECIMGDGMAKCLTSVGCAGAVIDGGIRDVAGIASTGFIAFARGTTVHHTKLTCSDMGEPVEVGGLTISQMEIVHGSEEGVIRIPRTCLEKLPDAAAVMRKVEHDVQSQWRRTDISIPEKRQIAGRMLSENGFVSK
jgi:4-hydroxy-4-methyl-2-oxoglutarate aldolase